MTKEEIIKMVKVAGGYSPEKYPDEWRLDVDDLSRFAKLVAEVEREACAKIAENRILHDENKNIKKGYLFAQQSIAQDIRTRRQE
jgi:hypothetical protein